MLDPKIMAQLEQGAGQAQISGLDPEIMAQLNADPSGTPDRSGGGGALNNILWTLGLLDRPRNALASGVQNLVDDDPNTGFFQGARQGFMGDRQVSWGDVVGIPHGQATDDWAPWLAKEGAHLAGDVIIDPSNLFFGAGAITKALGLSAKGVSAAGRVAGAAGEGLHALGMRTPLEAVAGSPWGKALFNKIPNEGFEAGINASARENAIAPFLENARAFKQAYTDAGIDPKMLTQAIERGTEDPVLQSFVEMAKPLLEMNRASFDKKNEIAARLNKALGLPEGLKLKVSSPIEEEKYTFMPRILSGISKWRKDQPGREFYNWTNPVTGEIEAAGAYGKTKGLTKKVAEDGTEEFFHNGTQVIPKQMSHQEVRELLQANKSLGPGKGPAMDPFIGDPAESLTVATQSNLRKIQYMQTLEQGLTDGWLTKITDPMTQLTGRLTKGMPGGPDLLSPVNLERTLNIPRFEGLKTLKPIANRLENMYQILYNPDHAIGKLEEFFKAFHDTRIGQVLNSFNTTWKKGALFSPGYNMANLLSNQSLMYLAGVRNPLRISEAAAVQIGKDVPSAVEGLSNAALQGEFKLRRVIEERASGQMAGGSDVLGESQNIPFMQMFTGQMGRPGEVIQKGLGLATKASDLNFKVAGIVENNARTAVAIDWLKKHVKGVPTAADLDAAAAHAKAFLFDYGDLTPVMQGLKQFLPFVSWTRSIIGRTLKDLGTQPQELANIGRFTDMVFQAPDERQRALLDPWQRNQGPAMGMFGWSPTSPEGLPGQFQTGRFVPQGTIEDLFGGFRKGIGQGMSGLGAGAMGMLAPWAKAATELPFNYNQYLQKPIDELAGNAVNAAINPITGGPYQQANQKLLGATVPAMLNQTISYTPVSRTLNQVNAMARGTLFEDPNQPQMSAAEKITYLMTGGKAYPFDEAKLMLRRQREDSKALAAAKSKAKYAAGKGDVDGFQFYMNQMQKIQMQQLRAKGMVEPGA